MYTFNSLGFAFNPSGVLREQLGLTVKMCRSWKHFLNFECEGLFLFQTPNSEPETIF